MKRRWQATRHQQGKSADRPKLITGPVQVRWHKFTRYFDVELREIAMVQPFLIGYSSLCYRSRPPATREWSPGPRRHGGLSARTLGRIPRR